MKRGISGRYYSENCTSQQVVFSERLYRETLRSDMRADARARAVGGLVRSCISHRQPSIQVYSAMFKIKIPSTLPSQLAGARRGVIRGFSAASRKRMLEKLAQWKLKRKVYFVTLTYHEYVDNFRAWKRDLDVFFKRMRRAFGDVAAMWRLEFQRRGAPHFHIIVTSDVIEYEQLKSFVTRAWAEIAHNSSVHKGKFATNVRSVNLVSRKHAFAYCAKYMSKTEDKFEQVEETGRCWGTVGGLDCEVMLEHRLSLSQVKDIRDAAIALLRVRRSRYADVLSEMSLSRGFSVFGVGMALEPGTMHWREFGRKGFEYIMTGDMEVFLTQ